MKKKKVYLDSCIFVSKILKEKKYKIILNFLKELENSYEFVTSDWSLSETIKVLIKEKKKSSSFVSRSIKELTRVRELDGVPFEWIRAHGSKKNYTFEKFFMEIQGVQLKFKGSLGDVIHAVIMKNNKVKYILTTDSEFYGMGNVITFNPLKKIFDEKN